jgi:hypothetical protein
LIINTSVGAPFIADDLRRAGAHGGTPLQNRPLYKKLFVCTGNGV